MIDIEILSSLIFPDHLKKLNALIRLMRERNLFAQATGPYPVSHGEDHIGNVIVLVKKIVEAIGVNQIREDQEINKESVVFELAVAALIHDVAMGSVAILSEQGDEIQRQKHAGFNRLIEYLHSFGFRAYVPDDDQMYRIVVIAWSHCGDVNHTAIDKSDWIVKEFTLKRGHRHIPLCMRILRFADMLDVGPHRLNYIPNDAPLRTDQLPYAEMHRIVKIVMSGHWFELQKAHPIPGVPTITTKAVRALTLKLISDLEDQYILLAPWFKELFKIDNQLQLEDWIMIDDQGTRDDNEKNKEIEIFVSSGVVSFDNLKAKERLFGEVFMAELLQMPIVITRAGSAYSILIDRNNVQELVISTKGKRALSEKYIHSDALIDVFKEKDKEIHRFLSGFTDNSQYTIPLNNDFKLRWASGGVLSVVTFRGKKWIPLFFRDIRPYGWNISLGSSERHFNENKVTNHIENELISPSRFICREFIEETLIIEGKVKVGKNNSPQIIISLGAIFEDEQRRIQFQADHLSLRKDFDGLDIKESQNKIETHFIQSNMSINITSPSLREFSESNVLVCFSLLDLGIEVVKVLTYNLPDECEVLDGEILETFNGKTKIQELTRMPVALISCEYLYDLFSGDITKKYDYTPGTNPSIEIDKIIPLEYIHIFEWDVMNRLEIAKGKKTGVGLEKKRYTDWYDKFGINFINNKNQLSKDNPSRLFTPATAKILNLLFLNTSKNNWI